MSIIDLRGLIEESIEPTEPQETIVRALAEFENKNVGKGAVKTCAAIIERLRQATGDSSIYIRHSTGATVCWKGSIAGVHIGYGDSPKINIAWIKEENKGLFEWLRERNTRRQAILDNPVLIKQAQVHINTILACRSSLEYMTQHGGPLDVVGCIVLRAAGLIK